MLVLEALATWLAMLAVAVSLGALRRAAAEPKLGEHRAHQVFTPLVCLAIAAIITGFIAWRRPEPGTALGLGVAWAAMTVAFEVGFFHYVMGVRLDRLLRDYNILAGRLWLLVLLTTLLTPWIAAVLIPPAPPPETIAP